MFLVVWDETSLSGFNSETNQCIVAYSLFTSSVIKILSEHAEDLMKPFQTYGP